MKQITPERVQHLEYIFSPPGLPMVARQEGVAETASVLVRGGPGTGKTTLAMALAMSLAREQKGRVLYLGTEISPADPRQKAADFGIPVKRIAPVDEARGTEELLLDHLRPIPGVFPAAPEARMAASMERLWEVVTRPLAGKPIRAAVIDAFALLQTRSRPDMRAKVMDFITGLESRGISLILVEESPPPKEDYLSYLVDLVFEVGWGTDPDTGKRYRELSCLKSRYVEARPGPFEYGRDDGGEVTVWPPISMVPVGELGVEKSPALIAGGMGTALFVLRPGSQIDGGLGSGGAFNNVVWRLAWLRGVQAQHHAEWGPDRLGWTLAEGAGESSAILVLVGYAELVRRRRFAASFPEAIRRLGAEGVSSLFRDGCGSAEAADLDLNKDGTGRFGGHTPSAGHIANLVGLPLPLREGWVRWVDGRHVELAQFTTTQLKQAADPGPEAPLFYAALHALHLANERATNWLIEQFPSSQGVLARHLVIPALHRAGRIDEARAALAELGPELVARVGPLLDAPAEPTG